MIHHGDRCRFYFLLLSLIFLSIIRSYFSVSVPLCSHPELCFAIVLLVRYTRRLIRPEKHRDSHYMRRNTFVLLSILFCHRTQCLSISILAAPGREAWNGISREYVDISKYHVEILVHLPYKYLHIRGYVFSCRTLQKSMSNRRYPIPCQWRIGTMAVINFVFLSYHNNTDNYMIHYS